MGTDENNDKYQEQYLQLEQRLIKREVIGKGHSLNEYLDWLFRKIACITINSSIQDLGIVIVHARELPHTSPTLSSMVKYYRNTVEQLFQLAEYLETVRSPKRDKRDAG